MDHLQPMLILALNTACRRGELFSLEWSSVDIERKMLTVRASNAKSGRASHIPLNAQAIDVLKRWKQSHDETASDKPSSLVFPRASGGRLTNINKSLAALVAAASISAFRFHDTRHDFASRLVMAGVDLYTFKELLGHSDFEMTQRYARLAPEHKAAAVERLVR